MGFLLWIIPKYKTSLFWGRIKNIGKNFYYSINSLYIEYDVIFIFLFKGNISDK